MDIKEYYEGGLEELRRRINAGEVSALIGAGFSRNVSNEFPLWDGLLSDMVCELFKPEIETGFQNQILYNSVIIKNDHQEYCKNKVGEIIQREGYLNIVSQYIKSKGYREAVEDYIEKHTPYIKESGEDQKIVLSTIDGEETLEKINFKAHEKLLSIYWQNIYTTNYDNLLEFTKDKFGKQWDLVKSAHDLAFNKQKNAIVKLHGDLCTSLESDSFEFDGNFNHRYIISREDYENYPKEHEAFTQLMRISLLRGTFCLIGFSGADPNFIGWIHWVRDILVKNNYDERKGKKTKKNGPKGVPYQDFKIFLIDMSEDEPTSDKKQFYKNHRIFYIPLLNSDVMKTIGYSGWENSSKNETNKDRELMVSLLAYLNNKQPQETYSDLWQQIYSLKRKNVHILKRLEQMKSSNRICQVVRYQKYFLLETYSKETFSEVEIRLILLALEDTYDLPDDYPGLTEKLETQIKSKTQRERFIALKNRMTTLEKPFVKMAKTDSDAKIYEQVLRNAFSLDFTALKKSLETWNPKETFIPKKAFFLSLFQKEKAQDLLLKYVDSECEIKEKYYAIQLLNLIIYQIPKRYSTAKYRNQNMAGLFDLKNSFLEKATKQDQEPNPYGDSRTIFHLEKEDKDYENSLRVLQFLMEGPFCLRFNGWIETIAMKDWYPVFKNLFEKYPFPILFYSLQGKSGDVLRRIGQEYAYSDVLSETNVKLLDCMLNALLCEDTPVFYRDNLYQISQELFVSVEPSCWERKFSHIWDKYVLKNYKEIKSSEKIYRFICSGLKFVRSKAYKTKFILDCLQHEKENKKNTINFLYNLRVSQHEIEGTSELKLAIDTFCSQLDDVSEYVVAGNLDSILSPTNRDDIAAKMKDIVQGDSVTMEGLRAIIWFSKKSGKQEQFVKQMILENEKLWNDGITEDRASSPNFIQLSSLKKMVNWGDEDIKTIYQKLKKSFRNVIDNGWYQESLEDFFLSYVNLFQEMLWFIRDNERVLSQETDITDIKSEIKNKLWGGIGCKDIMEALLSDDGLKVQYGLYELVDEIAISARDKFQKEINLLIDRILFKREEGLQSCLDYLVYILSNFYKENIPEDLAEKLMSIVQLYRKETLQNLELNVPDAAEYLIQISEFLVKRNYSPDTYWSDLKKSGRFNNL